MAFPGADAAAVVPPNLFVPGVMLAVSDTSFQGWPLSSCIWVKLPVTSPDPKFTEIDALPCA
jgi:hypothetical protein